MKHFVIPFILVLALVGCSSPTSSTPDSKTATHTVTFDSNGGSSVASQTVNDGAKVTKPTDPTNGVHNFLGWYNGSVAYDFNGAVTSDLTLTAKWTSTVTVEDTVRYDSSVTYLSLGKQWTDAGYVVMDLNAKTWTNYKVSKSNDTTSTLVTYPADTEYLRGSYSWEGATLTLTILVDSSGVGASGDIVYSTGTTTWKWVSGGSRNFVMYSFGKNGYTDTTVTKTVQASHTEEK